MCLFMPNILFVAHYDITNPAIAGQPERYFISMEAGTLDAELARRQLAELIIEDPDFGELEKNLSTYCPFEAVGMVNAEIRHSAFLAHALDPYRPHEFGPEFLRLLLDTILKALEAPPISRLELHMADFDNVDVRREWRHIDVLVALPTAKLVIAFELKIGAGEGHDQLGRYSRAIEATWPAEAGWRHLKLFLTRNAEQPSDDTWYPIDYGLVIDAIDRFKNASDAGAPLARQTLIAYATMLRRRHMGSEQLDKIAETLWKKHAEALNFLLDRRPDADGGLGQMLLDRQSEIAASVSKGSLTLVPERSNKRWIVFHVKEWSDIPGFTLAQWTPSGHFIQVQIEVDPRFVKLFVTLGPGPEEYRANFYNMCRDLMPRKGAKGAGWKTVSSKTILGRSAIETADGPEELCDRIQEYLRDWVRNEVAQVDARLRPITAGGIASTAANEAPTMTD